MLPNNFGEFILSCVIAPWWCSLLHIGGSKELSRTKQVADWTRVSVTDSLNIILLLDSNISQKTWTHIGGSSVDMVFLLSKCQLVISSVTVALCANHHLSWVYLSVSDSVSCHISLPATSFHMYPILGDCRHVGRWIVLSPW